MEEIKCHRCKEIKSITEFHRDKYNSSGHKGTCKTCLKPNVDKNNLNKSLKLEKELRLLAEQEYINMLSNDTNDEIWKDIPKYDGKYQASNLGRIRCTPKVFKGKAKIIRTKYYIVKSSLSNEGYRRVALTNKQGDKRIMGVHRWIMFAFQGEVSEDVQVNHINGVRNDNRLCNLEYVTPRQNNNHRKILNPDRFTSKYIGVYGSNRKRGGAKYESSITFNGKNYYLGSSNNDYMLSLKYKEALYNYENFGELPKPIEIKNRTSKIKGIGFHSLSGKYRVRYKEKYIGIFDTEDLAEKVYSMVEYLADNRGIELNGELINKFRNKFAIDKRLK